MLGNDVVDLEDVDARPETFRRRFDARVFADEERRAIAGDADPQACRWAHWGAKEAAYKLARQRDPAFVFSPIRLVARFEPRMIASVETGRGLAASGAGAGTFERRGRLELAAGPQQAVTTVELRSFETRECVHVVALPSGSDWGAVAMAVDVLGERTEDPGLAVRRLALRALARELGVESARLAIGRRARIPTVELDGRTTRLSLSLSHHGRFIAFAFTTALATSEREAGVVRSAADDRTEQRKGRDRDGSVRRSIGAVGYPAGVADTEWMAGCRT